MPNLFDIELRTLRRDRAARTGPELFLLERAFEDCLDRLSLVQQGFDRTLLIGSPAPDWPMRLQPLAGTVDVHDPGRLFAEASGGWHVTEDEWTSSASTYDLVLAVGTLDTVNDLPRALLAVRSAMRPGGLFLGALSGGDTLPRLRRAMLAADSVGGVASPHVHPRIEAAALAPLLEQIGFINPVVDVDRASVRYRSFADLVKDLRRMAATNILTQRSRRALSRSALSTAAEDFAASAEGGRTTETFEILHFACWTPAP